MANRSSFTNEQWRKILQAPLLAAFAVTAGDPSGLIGTLQEGMASARAFAAARADPGADALIKAVVDELLTPEGRLSAREDVGRLVQGAEIAEIKIRTLEELRNTGKILDLGRADRVASVQAMAERNCRPSRRGRDGGRRPRFWRGQGQRGGARDARRDFSRAGGVKKIPAAR